MSAETKLAAARLTVLLREPFFGALVHGLKLKADPTCKTAYVDGRSMGYNPKFIESLSHDRIVGTYVHEISHCAQGHPWRRGNRDPKLWNIACDKVINVLLRDAGFVLPDGVYYAQGEELGKSAEWIYARMAAQQAEEQAAQKEAEQPEEQEEQEQDEEQDEEQDGDQDGDGDEEQDGEDGDGEGQGDSDQEGEGDDDGEGQDGEGDSDGQGDADGEQEGGSDGQGSGQGEGDDDEGDPLGEVRDAPVDEDEDGDPPPTEQEWKEKVMIAYQTALSQGKGSDGLQRAVQDALRPRLDPRALLLRFFTERAAADYSWRTPNPRYQGHNLYLPALRDNTLGRIAIMVDTSGSMDESALANARGIVESVIEECKPTSVDLYYADDAVQQFDHFEQGEPLVWRPAGGGGTDFRPTFEAIANEPEVVCTVAITDLEGTFPDHEPDAPVIWLVPPVRWAWSTLRKAPWGETVNLEV